MTNEELIRRFFLGGLTRDTESYGLFVRPLIRESVGNFDLYSKTGILPIAVKPPKNYFIISTPHVQNSSNWKKHVALTTETAKQLGIEFVSSPHADATNFQKYMEEKINENLLILANDLRAGSYIVVPRSTDVDFPRPIFSNTNELEFCIAVPENYQKLMESIDALLEGERILGLPKHQVALIDTDEVQSMWRWLIKENPIKKDQELLRKTYTLSRLMAPKETEWKYMFGDPDVLFPTPK